MCDSSARGASCDLLPLIKQKLLGRDTVFVSQRTAWVLHTGDESTFFNYMLFVVLVVLLELNKVLANFGSEKIDCNSVVGLLKLEVVKHFGTLDVLEFRLFVLHFGLFSGYLEQIQFSVHPTIIIYLAIG